MTSVPLRHEGVRGWRCATLLIAGALFCFYASLAHAAVEISDGSVQALYHFNDQDLTDSSGKGRDGVQGATPFLFTTTSTKLGAASGNDQNTGFFTVTSTIMDLSGDFTVGFWMQPQAALTGGTYFFLRNTPGTNNNTGVTYAVACTGGHVEFVHNGSCKIDTAQTFTTGTWYWILMERAGSRLDAYVNGSLVQSVTDSLTQQSSTINVRFNGEAGGTGTGNMYYDEVFFTNTAISTSTRDALYNDGDGEEICTNCGGIFPSALHQYISDATTAIAAGGITTESTVVFGANLQSSGTSTVQLQVEVEAVGTSFTDTANVTSSFVSPNSNATATVQNLENGSYHWQARAEDSNGATSTWQMFGPSSISTDFIVAVPMSAYFDGSSAWRWPATNLGFNSTQPFTIEFWYETDSTSTMQFLDTRANGHNGFAVWRNPSGINFSLDCANTSTTVQISGAEQEANHTDPAGNEYYYWHHVAVTKDTTTSSSDAFKLYFDGVQQASEKCYTSTSTDTIWIGGNPSSSVDLFKGAMDEVRIWNIKRSPSDIAFYNTQEVTSLAENDPRVKQLRRAYSKETLLQADVAHDNTRNSYQSLTEAQKAALPYYTPPVFPPPAAVSTSSATSTGN